MQIPESTIILKKAETVIKKDASEIAGRIIGQLDADFAWHEVLKIAEWVHYLSTQD